MDREMEKTAFLRGMIGYFEKKACPMCAILNPAFWAGVPMGIGAMKESIFPTHPEDRLLDRIEQGLGKGALTGMGGIGGLMLGEFLASKKNPIPGGWPGRIGNKYTLPVSILGALLGATGGYKLGKNVAEDMRNLPEA